MSLIKKIQNTNHRENLWQQGSKIVLGVSGGPDSVFLLEFFIHLQKKYNLELIIAHVNYGLRGADSDKDQRLVARLAEKHELGIIILNPDLEKKISENKLREIRYDFFEATRNDLGFDSIAVAHTTDDQVETFLMRVIRGAGMKGLTGMQFKNNSIIRPLLETSKKEIIEYLKENKISFRTDKTNLESNFMRNKVRNKLIPFLEKNFNPNIRKTILDSTSSLTQDLSFLTEAAQKKSKGELSVKKLLSLHPALQRRVLLEKIKEKKSDLKNIEASHVNEILKALKSTKGKNQIVSFKGLKVKRISDRVVID